VNDHDLGSPKRTLLGILLLAIVIGWLSAQWAESRLRSHSPSAVDTVR